MKDEARDNIGHIVCRIKPVDQVEAMHQDDVVRWIASNAPLYRIARPDNPRKHLVSYFVLFDEARNKLLLVDHAKCDLWLPAGGHVDIDEDPRRTVSRECLEELGVAANFDTRFGKEPLFITSTITKGHGEHTDVSLWYVIGGDSKQELDYDPREMNGYKWLSPSEILAIPIDELDPHMHRFVRKLQKH